MSATKNKITKEKLDEKELIQRLKQGDQIAFQSLVQKYQPKLLAIACGITLDMEEGREIVQDVFISVHKNINTFREESSLLTWMRKITINLCLNWKRKWKRRFKWSHSSLDSQQDNTLEQAEKNMETPESAYMSQEFEDVVMKAVELMPEKIRVVFVLKTFEKISYEEIAQTLNIKKGTVSSRLHYARKFLADSIKLSKNSKQ